MRAAVGVVLDPLHHMLARQPSFVVDDAYPPLVAPTAMPDCDSSGVVPASQMLPLPLNGELEVRPPLPQMVVYRSLKMAQAVGAGLVCAQGHEFVLACAFSSGDAAVGGDCGLQRRRGLEVDGVGLGEGAGTEQRLSQP